MKFLCLDCDQVMGFQERQIPGDGTLAAVFRCDTCGREMALLTNPMETRLVSGMGVKIGGREVPEQPMELVRTNLAEAREDAFDPEVDPEGGEASPEEATTGSDGSGGPRAGTTGTRPDGPGASSAGSVRWSPAALERLERVPRFVRGMVKRIYTDYARERDIPEITPDVMDTARSDLGLEGM